MTKIQAHRTSLRWAASSTAVLMHLAGAAEPPLATPDPLREQAMTLVARQQDAQALALFEERARRQPDSPEALIDLGVALARMGRLSEARQRLDDALRTSPVHALAHDNLQQLQLNMARHAYAAALQTGQTLPPADTGLQWSPAPVPAAAPVAPAPATSTALAASATAGTGVFTMKTDLTALLRPLLASLVLLALGATAWALNRRPLVVPAAAPITEPPASTASPPITVLVPEHDRAVPEERLIQVYRLIGQGQWARALEAAESLVRDQPRFTLAQLVYGDLLLAHAGVLRGFGKGTSQVPGGQERQIAPLQHEARQRLAAWQAPPPAGMVPSQVLLLPTSVRQVVVVDGLRSRLFVLEHRAGQLVPTASLYAAIGRLGVGKQDEGDLRTPLGIYDITGRLESRQIGDFYGAGALPLSYPNEHDRLLRRTGANI